MDKYVEQLTGKYYGQKPVSVISLGGGFYGRVFLAQLNSEPYRVVIKIYLSNGLNKKEEEQLKILSKYASIRMPRVYFNHHADTEISVDALFMEYIEGINAGSISDITPLDRDNIANQIVDNLIGYHQVVHLEGFGEINGERYEKDWRVYYRKKAYSIYHKSIEMHREEKINDTVYGIVQRAYENYDKIFYLPIESARLIHGDYNTWNILLKRDLTEAAAVIDPFNCCWADPEFDLYQLDNANGKYLGLLNKYKAKMELSNNFEIKNSFYELFTEIMHFYDADIDVATSNIPNEARKLEIQMNNCGI